ncbi:hypothetical protein L6R52_16995 [Myxococcota bacterium]|nr:hypothetical protein [Myxococcota bacterium]
MITSRWITITLGAALLTSAACTHEADVLESTTTLLRPNEQVVARSADGLLSVSARITAPLEGAELTIATRRDVQAAGQRGLAYEVSVNRSVALAASAEVRVDVPTGFELSLSVVAHVATDGTVVELAAERSERTLVTRLATLERRLFTIVASQCGLSACGAPCGPAVATSSTACEPAAAASHVCSEAGACLPSDEVACQVPLAIDGWDDAPGTGRAFIVDDLAIAGADVVSDAADPCHATTPRNQLAPLALMNDQIRQGLLGGEWMMLVELAGIGEPFTGTDDTATFKVYPARDADDPFFPANNFNVPPGETTCCQFLVEPQGVAGVPLQARSRAPTRLAEHALRALAVIPARIPLGPIASQVDVLAISGHVEPGFTGLSLTLSGAWTVPSLAGVESPYCRVANPLCPTQMLGASMLDFVLVMTGAQPQVDLDFDGLESFHDDDGDGRVDRCIDGCIGACTTPTVVTSTQDVPCATDPRFADGYSITFEATAVPAQIVGIAGE